MGVAANNWCKLCVYRGLPALLNGFLGTISQIKAKGIKYSVCCSLLFFLVFYLISSFVALSYFVNWFNKSMLLLLLWFIVVVVSVCCCCCLLSPVASCFFALHFAHWRPPLQFHAAPAPPTPLSLLLLLLLLLLLPVPVPAWCWCRWCNLQLLQHALQRGLCQFQFQFLHFIYECRPCPSQTHSHSHSYCHRHWPTASWPSVLIAHLLSHIMVISGL